MKPILTITDATSVSGDVYIGEKTVALFGHVIYRRSECYPVPKDRTIGFNSCGTNLTYVGDE